MFKNRKHFQAKHKKNKPQNVNPSHFWNRPGKSPEVPLIKSRKADSMSKNTFVLFLSIAQGVGEGRVGAVEPECLDHAWVGLSCKWDDWRAVSGPSRGVNRKEST